MAIEQRLIDANAQIASIKKQYCAPCKEHGQDYNEVRCRSCWVDDGIGFLEDAPTVDAVEVVRCRDCEYGCEDHEDAYLCNNGFNGLIGFTRGDDFCSYGERRTT